MSLTSAPDGVGNHPEDRPCIISGINCPLQDEEAFDYTDYDAKGSDASLDLMSPIYSYTDLFGAVGNFFSVGFDVNDTNEAQTLSYFSLVIDGMTAFEYFGSTGNVPNSNNGTGFADYLLGVFDISGYSSNSSFQFFAELDDLNDGPEQFFLVADVAPIPVPAGGVLLLSALAGLGLASRRRKAL